MQAKDLSDVEVLHVVADAQAGRIYSPGWGEHYPKRWAHNGDVEAAFPDAPPRVVLAKMNALLRRNFITGCACGCSGKYELTAKGRAALRAK